LAISLALYRLTVGKLLGVSVKVYTESTSKIYINKRYGIGGKENIILYMKFITSLIALGVTGLVVIYSTGLNFVF
jgi:hypothetical protein